MIIQLDDIDNALIKDSGTLRSIISKNSSDGRDSIRITLSPENGEGFCVAQQITEN